MALADTLGMMAVQESFPVDVQEAFASRYGGFPQVEARAPGRVNLIGEHTDYSEGFVLPFAIDRDTCVVAAHTPDAAAGSRVRALACDLGADVVLDASEAHRRGDWSDYVRGVVLALAEAGHRLGGVDVAITSRVPRESGLSSSAALSVALVTALDALFELGLDAVQRARIAHRSENHFVGVGCGILDPFASALGSRDHALRIDCRTQQVEAISLPRERAAVLVAHSGITRALARGDYRDRVAECEAAFAAIRHSPGVAPSARSLRDIASEDLPRLEAGLDPVLFRRTRHVVRENARVGRVCEALARGDFEGVGAILREGHESLARDFEVSTPELDALCDIADALPGVWGSRLTGAGFGGCTLHWVAPEAALEVAAELSARFSERFGSDPNPMRVRPSEGARARWLA